MGYPGKAHIFAMPAKCLNTAISSRKYPRRPLALQIPHTRNCMVKLPLTLLWNPWRSVTEIGYNTMRFSVTSVFSVSGQQ